MPLIIRPVALTALSQARRDELTSLKINAGSAPSAGQGSVADEVQSMLFVTGIAHDGSDDSVFWHEMQEPPVDHKKLARSFGRLAEAADPLDPTICTPVLRAGLNRQVCWRWTPRWRRDGRGDRASLAQVEWASLTDRERDEIRAMARHLEAWHRSQVRAERPRKNEIDTALLLLADIYARHSGFDRDRYDLPHSVTTSFLAFALSVLKDFFDPTELTLSALSHRWGRVKAHASIECWLKVQVMAQLERRKRKARAAMLYRQGQRPKAPRVEVPLVPLMVPRTSR
jgi:hypothetical protein